MTLLSRIRTLPARYPSASLVEDERAYWLAVGLMLGRGMWGAMRRWGR